MGVIQGLPPDLVVGESMELLPNLWHLPRDVWDQIHAKTTGKGVKVAVLDTGKTNHPDLPQAVESRSFVGGDTGDRNGHGNHVCGTVLGAKTGVAPGATLVVGKVLSDSGSGGDAGIAAAIRWGADIGCDVLSMSLGGGFSSSEESACKYANDKGTIIVAAAGNAGFNGSNTIGYPGRFLTTCCVGATQEDGRIANFSSGGRELDVATPGQNIISTSNRGSGYQTMSGTSMATPFMAGLLCLIIEMIRREGHSKLTGVDSLRLFLEQWSEDRGDPGKDVRYGYGVPRYSDIVKALVDDSIIWG